MFIGHHKTPAEVIVLGNTADGLHWTIERRGVPPKAHVIKKELFGAKHTSWCHSRTCNAMVYGWADSEADKLPDSTTDLTYPSYHRAALAQGLHAGLDVPGLRDAYVWLDSEVRRLVSAKKLPVGDNWCVAPNETTVQRRHHRASDRSDLNQHPELRALLEEFRGED